MMNRPKTPAGLILSLLAVAVVVTGCGYVRRPMDRTDDGLVRVHSRDVAGVYRLPGAEFRQYRKVILEPAVIAFRPRWREAHADITDNQLMLIVQDAVGLFYEEFKRELIEKGQYEFAEAPGPDVLMISPRVTDLNIHAPDWSPKTYVPSTVTMQIAGDMHDGASNTLVGRVIIFENAKDSGGFDLTLADRITNAHEMRMGFRKWSKMIVEALNVAKATRPPT